MPAKVPIQLQRVVNGLTLAEQLHDYRVRYLHVAAFLLARSHEALCRAFLDSLTQKVSPARATKLVSTFEAQRCSLEVASLLCFREATIAH